MKKIIVVFLLVLMSSSFYSVSATNYNWAMTCSKNEVYLNKWVNQLSFWDKLWIMYTANGFYKFLSLGTKANTVSSNSKIISYGVNSSNEYLTSSSSDLNNQTIYDLEWIKTKFDISWLASDVELDYNNNKAYFLYKVNSSYSKDNVIVLNCDYSVSSWNSIYGTQTTDSTYKVDSNYNNISYYSPSNYTWKVYRDWQYAEWTDLYKRTHGWLVIDTKSRIDRDCKRVSYFVENNTSYYYDDTYGYYYSINSAGKRVPYDDYYYYGNQRWNVYRDGDYYPNGTDLSRRIKSDWVQEPYYDCSDDYVEQTFGPRTVTNTNKTKTSSVPTKTTSVNEEDSIIIQMMKELGLL